MLSAYVGRSSAARGWLQGQCRRGIASSPALWAGGIPDQATPAEPSNSGVRRTLCSRLDQVGHSATMTLHEVSNELKRSGKMTVYKLGLGQSPFPVPDIVVEELKNNSHRNGYQPVKGLYSLRKAAAAHYAKATGCDLSAEDIMVGPGSKELMFVLLMAYDAEILLPNPSWVSYFPQAQLVGREVKWLQTSLEENWKLTPATFREHCEKDPEKSRVLVLNFPSNPTGMALDEERLRELAEVAREFKVLVLADEIYGEVHHKGKHLSMMTYYPEGTIVSGGISKWCGAGGWRLGLYAFPPQLRWLLDAMAIVGSETYTSVSSPIQYAAVRAYTPCDEIKTYVEDSQRILDALGQRVVEGLRKSTRVNVVSPEGGFYVFPDFSFYRDRLAARGVTTSAQMCEALLRDTGVALLSGENFGRAPEELFARIAWVNFDGATALKDIRHLPKNAPKAEVDLFLREHCGDTLKAAELVADWFESL